MEMLVNKNITSSDIRSQLLSMETPLNLRTSWKLFSIKLTGFNIFFEIILCI